jgi:hypothetical protein
MRNTGIKAGFVKRGAREYRPLGCSVASSLQSGRVAQTTEGKSVRFAERLPMACGVRSLLILLVLTYLFGAGPASAVDQSIDAFFGIYEGTSISGASEGISARDMKVSIAPTKRGFSVTWNTTTHKAGGKDKVKTYSIDFEPTKREGIFGSEMRRNKFGDRVPLDPLDGEPYVWARITGNVLTVYALHITAEGSYEMQEYQRTRTEEGLSIKFTRYGDGEPIRVVTGTLAKVSP